VNWTCAGVVGIYDIEYETRREKKKTNNKRVTIFLFSLTYVRLCDAGHSPAGGLETATAAQAAHRRFLSLSSCHCQRVAVTWFILIVLYFISFLTFSFVLLLYFVLLLLPGAGIGTMETDFISERQTNGTWKAHTNNNKGRKIEKTNKS
jgi:hypothetical protein